MLNETGEAPRSGPLRAGYFVHFLPLNLALRFTDACLSLLRWFRRQPPPLPEQPSILVSQPGHLGDVVIATAVIEPLQRQFPGCHIGFLVSSWSAAVLKDHPSLLAVHVFDQALLNRSRDWRFKSKRHFSSRRKALDEVRAIGYDLCIELSFNFPNNIAFSWAAGIPRRVGYTSGGFGPLLTDAVRWEHRPDWSVMRYHEQLLRRARGAGPNGEELLVVRKSLLPSSGACSATLILEGVDDYTVLHLGSGGPLKEWPVSRWSDLIDRLLERGRTLVFTGSGEREMSMIAEAIRGRPRCIDVSGRVSWHEFVQVVRRATSLISVDSAAGHVAAAFGVPTVTVGHGLTDFALYRPQSDRQASVRNDVPCAPCYRSRGCPSMNCIRDIDALDVLQEVS